MIGLGIGAGLGTAFGIANVGCGAGSDPCATADSLSTSERSLRASFHYSPLSPHGEARRCQGCAFFRAAPGAEAGCGECEILQGLVSAAGHCDSYSPRAQQGSRPAAHAGGAMA